MLAAERTPLDVVLELQVPEEELVRSGWPAAAGPTTSPR